MKHVFWPLSFHRAYVHLRTKRIFSSLLCAKIYRNMNGNETNERIVANCFAYNFLFNSIAWLKSQNLSRRKFICRHVISHFELLDSFSWPYPIPTIFVLSSSTLKSVQPALLLSKLEFQFYELKCGLHWYREK